MAGKSDFAEIKVLGHLLGLRAISPPSSYFIRLHSVLPADDGTGGTELSGDGYAPKEVVNNTTNFVIVGNTIENGVDFAFAAASGADWDEIVGFSLWSASSGGNCWFVNELDDPITILDGQIFKFEAGDLVFTES